MYLQKASGDYIPFRIGMRSTNCNEINKMFGKKNVFDIWYIDKDDK